MNETILDPMHREAGSKPFDPSFGAVCNMCHFSMGVAIVMTVAALGGVPLYGFFGVLAWTLLKDLGWDMWKETTTWKDECFDVAMYAVGAGLALAAVLMWGK